MITARNMSILIAVALVLLIAMGCEVKPEMVKQTVPEIRETEVLPVPDNATINYCKDYCSFVQGGENDKLEYNDSSQRFVCSCSDYSNELTAQTEITPRDLNLYSKKKIWWENLPITYQIMNEQECGSYEVGKIKKAFQRIEEATDGVVYFEEANSSADIEITCKFIKDCYKKEIDVRKEEGVIYKYESICSHAAGIAEITEQEGFKLKKAEITLVGLDGFAETTGRGMSGFYVGSCGHPNVEIHEILHTFGFGHSNDPENVMYYQAELVPYTIQKEGACIGSDKNISEDIVDELLLVYGR